MILHHLCAPAFNKLLSSLPVSMATAPHAFPMPSVAPSQTPFLTALHSPSSPLFLSISLSLPLPLHLPLHPALLFINEAPCSYTAFPLHGKHAEHANPPKCTLLLADNRHCAFISYLRYDFKQLAETFGLYYECLLQDNNILGLLLLMFQSRAYYGYTTLLAVWVPGSLTLLICVCS